MMTRAFTLTELMVAITVIAILAAILIPAANGAIKKAEKAKAKSAAVELANAIRHYQSEYGVLPVAMFGGANLLPSAKYADFIKMLQGTKTTTGTDVENTRAIKFLDKTDDAGTYKDPWDNDFLIFMDTNYSGTITHGSLGIDGSVYQPVVVMSYGPKGKSDDIPNFVHSANVTYDKSTKKWKVVK